MRLLGGALALIGLVVMVVAAFSGCNSLFAWNGRHAVYAQPLPEGSSTHAVQTTGGRRYTIGVQIVFDREGLDTGQEGSAVVEASIPLVVRVKDAAGTTLAETTGWLDPNKHPNVLYGHAEPRRRPIPELAVERLVGPFGSASDVPVAVTVDLGADRIGTARILERRLVVFDDALPPSIRNAFVAVGAGAAVFVGGLILTVIGWFKRRKGRKPRKAFAVAP